MTELLLRLSAKVLAHFDNLSVIEFSLLTVRAKARIVNFLEFLRKVAEDFLLGPSENKGSDHSAKPLHPVLVHVLYDRRLKFPEESAVVVKEGRHDVIENAPQLAEAVLDRRACQREPRLRFDELYTLRRFRPLVLDILRLIDDLVVEAAVLVFSDVALNEVVGCHQNIVLIIVRDHLSALVLSPRDNLHAERRRETVDLLLPVVEERGRAHNERSRRLFPCHILIVVGEKKRCGLQCFAKPHVIRQNTAEPVLIEHAHPSVADGLIFAEHIP